MSGKTRTAIRIGLFIAKSIVKIAVYIMIFYAIIDLCRGAFSFGYAVFNQEPVAETYGMDVTVEIPIGASAGDVGEILEEKGLIRDGDLFILQEFFSNYHGKIQEGTFVLNTTQTPDEMLRILTGGVLEEDSD